jgi:hypothetical protein
VVGLVDVVELSAPPGRIGQELHDGRLVRDDRPNQIGLSRDELETDRRAAAAAVHVRRLVGDGCEDRCGIVRLEATGRSSGSPSSALRE